MNAGRSRASAAGLGLFALTFLAAGIAVILMAYDYLPHGRLNAPPWIAVVVGLCGVIPGLAFLGMAIRGLVTPATLQQPAYVPITLMVAALLTCMAVALGGVVLFGEDRGFAVEGLTGFALEGRIAFGLAALLLGALAGLFWLGLIGRFVSRLGGRR